MDFKEFIDKKIAERNELLKDNDTVETVQETVQENEEVPDNSIENIGKNSSDDDVNKPDSYYFNIINEETGFRYDIPMLSSTAPGYFYKYVYYMKIKETSPRTFEKIMGWE